MTSQPATLQIDPRRWRMLFADSMQVTANFMAQHETLAQADLRVLLGYLDEAKLMATAWYQAGRPATAPEPKREEVAPIEQPVKRGGWPKGKPRKRNNPQVMQ